MPVPPKKPAPGRIAPTYDPDRPDPSFLPAPPSVDGGAWAGAPTPEVPAETPGRYQVVEGGGLIGQGGLGVVYSVWDEVLQREVACKLLPGVAEGSRAERFLREARATAGLQHPGIVPVHELGRRSDGQLYYTMKYVRGRTLAEAIAACGRTEERLRLLGAFVDVCQAVAFAHSRGILHRDLKPANVMVGEFGETVVLDWGLARVEGVDDVAEGGATSGPSQLTMVGAVLGTPAYMSPEQAAGRPGAVDARADVWSLGVVLFEILAGRTPFSGADSDAVLRAVREQRPPGLRDVAPGVPRELAAIVDKALSAEAGDRYPTAGALAADVEAFRAGVRVSAYEYGPWELLERFVARYRLPLFVAGVATLALVAVGAGSYARVLTERDRAQEAESLAVTREKEALAHLADALAEKALGAAELDPFTAELFAAGALAQGERPEARGVLARVRREWAPTRVAFRSSPRPCHALEWLPDGALACLGREGLTVWEPDGGVRFDRAIEGGLLRGELETSPDGSVLAVAQEGGRLLLLDAHDGGTRRTIETSADASIRTFAFSRDGGRVFGSVVDSDAVLVAWDTRTGAQVGTLDEPVYVEQLERGPDGSLWGTTRGFRKDHAGVLHVDADTLAVLDHRDGAGSVLGLAVPPDAAWVAAADFSGRLAVWDLPSGRVTQYGEHAGMGWVRLSPDGRLVAHGRQDGSLVLWQPGTWRPLLHVETSTDVWGGFAFSPDGSRFVLAEAGGVAFWTVGEVPAAEWLYGTAVLSSGLQVLADGKRVLANAGGVSALWDIGGRLLRHDEGTEPALGFSAAPDGMTLARSTVDGIRIEDVTTGTTVRALGAGRLAQGVYADDGRVVAAIAEDGAVVAYDVASGAERWRTKGEGCVWLSAGRSGRLLALLRSGTVALLSPEDGTAQVIDGGQGLFFATQSSDGRWIAMQWGDGALSVIDATTAAEVDRFTPGGGLVRRVRVSPDGSLVAAGCADRAIRLWDRAEGRVVAVLRGHQQSLQELAFTPDGRTLLSAAWGSEVIAWDLSELHTPGAELLARAEARSNRRLDGVRIVGR